MTKIMARTSVTLCAALLAAGCATQGPRLEPPAVELTGIALESLSFSEQRFRLAFDVANPNAVALPVKEVRYRVVLEDTQFAAGATGASFTIPARGSERFEIGVELDLVRSAASLLPLLREGTARPLAYELHGSLAVAIPFAPALRFSESGTIVVH